jgi:hypothetical protein
VSHDDDEEEEYPTQHFLHHHGDHTFLHFSACGIIIIIIQQPLHPATPWRRTFGLD